jgi:hypothetical protein
VNRLGVSAAAAAGAALAAAVATQQGAAQENGVCRIGAQVTNRQGVTGVVVEAPDPTGCRVRYPDGSTRYSLTWMLAAAGGAKPGASGGPAPTGGSGGAPSGSYQCYGGQAGNMTLTFKGGQYANAQGKTGAYSMGAGGRLAFTSGPWAGFHGRVLPDGKVGLSSKPDTTTYYMVCERN